MSVVINEFEVVPREDERAPAPAPPPAAEKPSPEASREIERAVALRREREFRLKAD